MRRAARVLFIICSTASLVSCVAVCVLWAREGDTFTRPTSNGWRQVGVNRGRIYYLRTAYPPGGKGSDVVATDVSVPCSAVAASFAAAFVVSEWLRRETRRSRAPGFCRNCGYDLRASPARCPECGTAAK